MELTKIRSQAMVYLARREHTRAEIEVKLARKKFPPEAISAVLDELVEKNLISHTRYIEDFLESRVYRGYGPNRIRAELLSRRLDKDDINTVLNKTTIDWLANAQQCYQKRYGDAKVADTKDYMKRKQFLHQRGYSTEIIRQVLES